MGVSAAENMRFPVMGDIMLSQQTIFVDREVKESGLGAAEKIKKVVENPEFPRVVIYPEGNTSNGRQVASFKLGAFQQARQAAAPRPPSCPSAAAHRRTSGAALTAAASLGAPRPPARTCTQQGKPVQPVVIRYPNTHLDVAWVEPLGLPVHVVAIRMMLQARTSNFRTLPSLHLQVLPPHSSKAGRAASVACDVSY